MMLEVAEVELLLLVKVLQWSIMVEMVELV
jgi:hypothetical protein